jgi:hypothetical protein
VRRVVAIALKNLLHRKHALEYTTDEAKAVIAWHWERTAGYPNLKKFEGGAQRPAETLGDIMQSRPCDDFFI